MKAESDKACTDIVKIGSTYGSGQGIYPVLVQKMYVEYIWKYNNSSPPQKHMPLQSYSQKMFCLLPGCDQSGHLRNDATVRKFFR